MRGQRPTLSTTSAEVCLATGVSAPYRHIRPDAWPAEFWVACCETTEFQIDNALVRIDDAFVRIEADIGAAF